MSQLGRVFIGLGLLLAVVGVLLMVGARLGLGRLPGDLVLERKQVRVYFPIVTSILVSLVLSVLLNLWLRRR